jgi:hypothetical protein
MYQDPSLGGSWDSNTKKYESDDNQLMDNPKS